MYRIQKLQRYKVIVPYYENLEKIAERRIRQESEIGEEQFGFLPGRSTTDVIFSLKQLMERHREMQEDLHMVLIDLEKAYDRVPRQEVWRCLRGKNVPEKYVRLVKEMDEGAESQVKSSYEHYEGFFVNVGLHRPLALICLTR
ncbi:uncharacterized protein [Centruroides vittatus]|uniref:uncharacterized protein n=1 Tax=Centruroides vittatus TaxID=120091 RepID=UPI00350F42F8